MINILKGIGLFVLVVIGSLVSLVFGDVEWTRFKGTVKAINLKASTITIQNSDGDVFTVPIDYQVLITDTKRKAPHVLKDIQLNDKVTLIKVISDKPKEDYDDLVPYRGMDKK